jgi:DNA-directed RNA polymerase subunit RPC12/RpoP
MENWTNHGLEKLSGETIMDLPLETLRKIFRNPEKYTEMYRCSKCDHGFRARTKTDEQLFNAFCPKCEGRSTLRRRED